MQSQSCVSKYYFTNYAVASRFFPFSLIAGLKRVVLLLFTHCRSQEGGLTSSHLLQASRGWSFFHKHGTPRISCLCIGRTEKILFRNVALQNITPSCTSAFNTISLRGLLFRTMPLNKHRYLIYI